MLKPTFPANRRTIAYFLEELLVTLFDCLS